MMDETHLTTINRGQAKVLLVSVGEVRQELILLTNYQQIWFKGMKEVCWLHHQLIRGRELSQITWNKSRICKDKFQTIINKRSWIKFQKQMPQHLLMWSNNKLKKTYQTEVVLWLLEELNLLIILMLLINIYKDPKYKTVVSQLHPMVLMEIIQLLTLLF